jgi:hypothetical protein
MAEAAGASAAPQYVEGPMGTIKERKRFIENVAHRRYVKVLQQLSKGADPNADWKGLLPLRTAVLVGDVDMVALLCDAGANPRLEPSTTTKKEVDGAEVEERVVLGKNPRMVAAEMAAEIANPLNSAARAMLKIMADPEEARKRVITLHSTLEADLSKQVREAMRNLILGTVGCVAVGLFYWYVLRPMDANPDPREL